MKVTLRNSEMLALRDLLMAACDQYNIGVREGTLDEDDILDMLILERLCLQVQKRSLERKPKYTLTIEPDCGLVFRRVFSRLLFATGDGFPHAGNLVRQICDQVHKDVINKYIS